MNQSQSAKLKIGDRVQTNDVYVQPKVAGTVIEVGYNAVKVKWDDGVLGLTDHKDGEWFDLVEAGDGVKS